MKIAITHYHLRRGGVTQVIASAIESLKSSGHEIVVFAGEAPPPEIAEKIPNVEVIEGLGYRKSGSASEATALAQELRIRAGNPDVWHFHNHALGKNVLMPQVVAELAREAPVLLQAHDFAEDGRSGNFARQLKYDPRTQLWPQALQIHYATINRRDFQLLWTRGFAKERLSMLPNAVSGFKLETTPADRPFALGKKFYLYPVRGIRRKNIGEFLLHAHFHRDDAEFATSLAPENPEWKAIHNHWKSVAQNLNLPVKLGDHGHAFSDLVGWSDAMITTSIAEGFGLAFLEPWLSGKSVVGRDLIDITADFPVNLNHLYSEFWVPIDLISLSELKTEIGNKLEQSYTAYGRQMPVNAVETGLESMMRDGKIDFGRLSESFQTTILENPKGIEPPSIEPCSPEMISDQRGAVQQAYSVASYGEKLDLLYQNVGSSQIGDIQNPGPDILLDSFLDPARFNLLRT